MTVIFPPMTVQSSSSPRVHTATLVAIRIHGYCIKTIPGSDLCRGIGAFFPFCRSAVLPNQFGHFPHTVNSVQNGSDRSLSECIKHALLKAAIPQDLPRAFDKIQEPQPLVSGRISSIIIRRSASKSRFSWQQT